MVRIRVYQPQDQERLEACILELQNFERTLEPDRVEGARMVARNREELLAIVRQNRGQIFVAEVNAEVVGFVCVRLEHEEDEYLSTLVDYAYISDLVVLPSHRGQRLRDELHKRNCTPVLFDFEKPATRDFTETVRILAYLARFIIADLTDPSSIPQELQAIVPVLQVPVQPLLLEAKREYSMFVDFRKCHWVLPIHLYTDRESKSTHASSSTYVARSPLHA